MYNPIGWNCFQMHYFKFIVVRDTDLLDPRERWMNRNRKDKDYKSTIVHTKLGQIPPMQSYQPLFRKLRYFIPVRMYRTILKISNNWNKIEF